MSYLTSQAIGQLEQQVSLNLKLRNIKEQIDSIINVQRLRLDQLVEAKELAIAKQDK
tara:strand:+ start:289 stop:459 length:171 start_codon:yes stop_codon:yes gene_type:complete